MKQRTKEMKIFLPGSFLAMAIAVYCIVANENHLYEYLYIIPAAYAVGLWIFGFLLQEKTIYKVSLVFYISQALMYIRYVITPFFTVFSAKYTSWGWGPDPTDGEMLCAELLMCLEAWLLLAVQFLAIRRFSKPNYLSKTLLPKNCIYDESILLIVYAIFACGLVLLVQPKLLIMDKYFGYSSTKNLVQAVPLQGLFVILADTFKKVFLIVALTICKKGYDRKKNKLFLVLAVLSVAVNMALNSGSTRIRMVFALILGVYFLNYVFGKIPRVFYVVGGALCLVSFVSVSLVKFSYAINESSTNPVVSIILVMSGQFQDYFAGPRLVGQMFGVHRVYGDSIGVSTFLNDFLGSVPFVSNFIDQTNRINYLFNIYCGITNQTLIAPVLGIGYCYFPCFPFFFSMIFEYFAIRLDYAMASTNRISYKYLYAYMGYLCAMCMGYSTQNIFAQFANAFVPLWVLFKVNDWLKLKINTLSGGKS